MSKLEIVQLHEVTDDVTIIINKLIQQLATDRVSLTPELLENIIKSDNTLIFLAKMDGMVVGTFSMVIYRISTGMKALIEDVVVDFEMRGRGIGEAMLRCAVKYVADMGISKLDLTSKPSRVAANTLYRKIGFKLRETNVYRLEIE